MEISPKLVEQTGDKEVEELVEWVADKVKRVPITVHSNEGNWIITSEDRQKLAKQILSHLDLALVVKCERCAGRGVFHSEGYGYGEDKPITCSQCHGTGIIPIPLAEMLKEAKDG